MSWIKSYEGWVKKSLNFLQNILYNSGWLIVYIVSRPAGRYLFIWRRHHCWCKTAIFFPTLPAFVQGGILSCHIWCVAAGFWILRSPPLNLILRWSNEYSLSIISRPHDHKLRKYLSLKSRILYLTQCVNDLQIWIINTIQHNI